MAAETTVDGCQTRAYGQELQEINTESKFDGRTPRPTEAERAENGHNTRPCRIATTVTTQLPSTGCSEILCTYFKGVDFSKRQFWWRRRLANIHNFFLLGTHDDTLVHDID